MPSKPSRNWDRVRRERGLKKPVNPITEGKAFELPPGTALLTRNARCFSCRRMVEAGSQVTRIGTRWRGHRFFADAFLCGKCREEIESLGGLGVWLNERG